MKRKLLLLLLLVSSFVMTSQNVPEIEWQRTIGGNNEDHFRFFYPTNDDGFVLVGNSKSDISGLKTENSYGDSDIWVVKINASGNIEWQKTLGGGEYDDSAGIRPTDDGGYIVGGTSFSGVSGNKTDPSKGNADYWVIKLDSAGEIEWQKTIGGSGQDDMWFINLTSDGGYILSGSSRSNASGDKSEDLLGILDIWIVKLDSTGNIEWENTLGGEEEDFSGVIEQTIDGGYIIAGSSSSNISGDKSENSQGYRDGWIIKLDASGLIEWENTIGGSASETMRSLLVCDDNTYLFAGNSGSNASGDKTEDSRGGTDMWLLKLDTSGNILWQRTIGGEGNEGVSLMSTTSDGGYIIGGTSNSGISGEKTEDSRGSFDYWVLRLDEQGSTLWQRTLGGEFGDFYSLARTTSDGGYLLGGSSPSNASGDKTEDRYGANDFWLIKLEAETLSSEEIDDLSNIMYPNPAGKNLYIVSDYDLDIVIYDTNGRKVLATKNKDIDLDGFSKGVYLVKIYQEQTKLLETKKLIIK